MRIALQLAPALALVLLPMHPLADRAARADDPPSRVGRLSFLGGTVSYRPGSVEDWAAASINYPLTTGDHLWTDADARAEVTVGSNAIRLAPQSAFAFLALDDRTTQVRLSQGSLDARVRNLGDNDVFEIDTPNGAVSLLRPGSYRIDVDSTGDTTTVTVRRGEAEVTAAGSAFPVRAPQAAVVTGTDSPSYDIQDALPPDSWEDWCSTRDRRWDEARADRYVSREVNGAEDLNEYGEWHESGQYGEVWVPRTVVAGWAPYRFGHWAWVDPWGWTWIDDAPWGFAPFHYGRWVFVDGGWGWVPGRVVAVRPVYAPALVVFVGGPHWSLSISSGGGGGVAWFPLAPEEPYVPAYRVSNTYVRNVNVTNVTNVTNITNVTNVTNVNQTNVNVTNINYKNREAPDAVTGVSRETFVGARPVEGSAVIVPRERLASAALVGAAPAIAPTHESVIARRDNAAVSHPPERVTERAVVARTAPPPPPVPFVARQQALQAHPGRPLDDAALASIRTRQPEAQSNRLVRPATPEKRVGGAPSLKPAREGLVAPQAQPATGFAPRPAGPPPGARNANRAPAPNAAPATAPAPAAAAAERPPRSDRPRPAGEPAPGAAAAPGPRPAAPPAAGASPGRGRADTGNRPPPAARPAPAQRPAPADRSAPPPRQAPTERPAPAEHPAPGAAKPQPAAQPAPAAPEPRRAERPAPSQPPAARAPAPGRRQERAPKEEKDTSKKKPEKPRS
jgi:FecR protein